MRSGVTKTSRSSSMVSRSPRGSGVLVMLRIVATADGGTGAAAGPEAVTAGAVLDGLAGAGLAGCASAVSCVAAGAAHLLDGYPRRSHFSSRVAVARSAG